MSFGVSVGDLITVFDLVNRARKRFVDAPDQFKAISHEWVNPYSNIPQAMKLS
jgi:hypothetical protein